MKQDKITINGPKNDGTYIVEFKTADGVALAFSVPKGGGTAVLEYFQDKMPYGSRCRMSHGVCHRAFTGSSPAVGAVPTKSRVFHRRPCSPAGNYQPAAAYEDRILLQADRRRCELIAGARIGQMLRRCGFAKFHGARRPRAPVKNVRGPRCARLRSARGANAALYVAALRPR